ncbi:OsmC family protein [Streptomyces fuscigenes]|uniref:OsmC family protein n=1 Tax=Streptomyces fuscigenes TaxID=1528880 RepID=UPI001F491F97|nr:OsmC family protein [Streptomyces fuscigenes]MCF3961928.1 OsmC family protein [Streptomyces fuscigenes]
MSELEIERTARHEFTARNARGAVVTIGRVGGEGSFTPGELLQIAAAGCAAVTVEELVVRRSGPEAPFTATVDTDRRPGTHEYDALHVGLDVDLSALDEAARERVVAAIRTAVERECTVSRTIEKGTPVTLDVRADGPTGARAATEQETAVTGD